MTETGKIKKEAWEQALQNHLSALDAEDQLELYLQLEGPSTWSTLSGVSADLETLKRAARTLAQTGRIRVRRGRRSGKVVLEATTPADRQELSRKLLAIMAAGGVEVPKGTRLARRIAAAKGRLTREANNKQAA